MPIDNPANSFAFASRNISFDKCTNNKIQLSANTANSFLGANKNRIYAVIINTSISEKITLVLGETNGTAIGKGIVLYPGGSFEINLDNLYVGKITALAEAACELSYVECLVN